ncbi:MAG: hypothetical protein LBG27_08725 [Spirochaetaceae bacterium]|jgi:hypothetical protein|nr:hypothetical protein [Spirochaetaceae bacterium]
MKQTAFAVVMLAAAWRLFAQQGGRQQFDLSDGGRLYRGKDTLSLDVTFDGKALVMSGTASGVTRGGGGYIIARFLKKLKFSGSKKLFMRVSGISGEDDRFNMYKLLKLELNGIAQRTVTPAMRNKNDPDYINARNKEAEFDISGMRFIRSINLVFYDCAMKKVKIEVFYE